jgi:ABC-2 type transport system ATP-binding protein
MTQQSPLVIDAVSKAYGTHKALQQASLSLQQGEIFGLIGLNGAGKTTMIKTILNLIYADEGRIEIFGHPSFDVEARRQLSYLPEKFQPSRYLRGIEYLDLSLSYYGKGVDREQARKTCAALDLNPDVLDQRVGSYSKGMGQKLGLAAALMIAAPLYILDEPMSGLDPRARIALKDELLKAKKAGSTVFFSSHILSDIDEICDRIGVIHQGEILYVGTPKDFKAIHAEQHLERAFLNAITVRDKALAAAA